MPRGGRPSSQEAALPATKPVPRFLCQTCGRPARVQVLEGYTKGKLQFSRLCLECGRSLLPGPPGDRIGRRPPAWALIGLAGMVVLAVGLLGDRIIPDGHVGFGWRQQLGALLGAALGLIGLLLGTEMVVLAGALLFSATLSADWLGLTRGPGIGRTQQWVIFAGLAILAFGLLVWLRWGIRPRGGGQRPDGPRAQATSSGPLILRPQSASVSGLR